MSEAADEFYVGYLDEAPSHLARVTRSRVTLVCGFALLIALALVVTQQPFGKGMFEFGQTVTLKGQLVEQPAPALIVQRPGLTGDRPAASRYLLSSFGKFGAKSQVSGLDGRAAAVTGTLIYRDDRTMIELADDGIQLIDGDLQPALSITPTDLGLHTLQGEIVDSKCFLGVMKPGNLKPHRACATRCISGGVPPALLVRDELGYATYLLLVGAQGQSINQEILSMVAEPVQITGRVMRHDDLLVIHADPENFRRLE
ncbi:MAG: hypothetical protein ACI9EF_001750 [Pseudohongiellaceae bacterium]|jgi:hypothetical protein